MNWKEGDKIWIDYDWLSKNQGPLADWTEWFPPERQPFIIKDVYDMDVMCTNNLYVDIVAIYNKNYIVTQILKDL